MTKNENTWNWDVIFARWKYFRKRAREAHLGGWKHDVRVYLRRAAEERKELDRLMVLEETK